jgi:hypothetical protein
MPRKAQLLIISGQRFLFAGRPMVQFAYVQNRVWRAPKALAGRVLPLLAAGRFRRTRNSRLKFSQLRACRRG